MRRSVGLDVDDLLRSVAGAGSTMGSGHDDVADRILDAASELFVTVGVRRCSVDDIAERSGVGRTTVYRRFEGRNQIVEAVLAREVRRFFTQVLTSTAHLGRFEDVVVESFLVGLRATETGVLAVMVRSEPDLLRLLTIDGGPVVEAARELLRNAFAAAVPGGDADRAGMVAELLVRLAISFVLTPASAIPLDDPDEAAAALHRLLDPMLAPLVTEP